MRDYRHVYHLVGSELDMLLYTPTAAVVSAAMGGLLAGTGWASAALGGQELQGLGALLAVFGIATVGIAVWMLAATRDRIREIKGEHTFLEPGEDDFFTQSERRPIEAKPND